MIAENSFDAFNEIRKDELGLGQRQLIVYSGLLYLKVASNAQIAKHLRLPINCVTGRVFELRQKKLVVEAYKDLDQNTKKKVSYWTALKPGKIKKEVQRKL